MTSLLIRLAIIGFFTVQTGCSGDEKPVDATTEAAPEKEKGFNKLDPNALADAVNKAELVPSPIEMEAKLKAAGLQQNLGALIPTSKDLKVIVEDNDQVAIRTGIVMADLVLTLKTSEQESILKRLGKMKEGLKKLGAGDDIYAVLEDFETRVKDNSVKKEELLEEFDELSQVMVSELEYEAGEWVVPLIQAGTWLEGANLVAKVMHQENKYNAADEFFRQKEIVEYFISYIDRDGKDRAPDQVVAKLITTLNDLKNIADKPKISGADVQKIETLTDLVLNLL
jgi:hypothetical protein